MAILTAETLALLTGRTFSLTAIEFDSVPGMPDNVTQTYTFGAVSTLAGEVFIEADLNGYTGGQLAATIGALFALEDLRHEWGTTRQPMTSLDLDDDTLIIDYGLYKETYTEDV
jgi:hypothetical protein